jgi:hypothetical protein
MSDSLSMIKSSLIFWQITLRRNAKGKGRGSKRDKRKGRENESLLHLPPLPPSIHMKGIRKWVKTLRQSSPVLGRDSNLVAAECKQETSLLS